MQRTRIRLLATAVAAIACAIAGGAAVARAATFEVNSTVDQPASAPVDDGVCETAPGNGVCTLRAAIEEANHTPGDVSLVRVPGGTYVLTIPPDDGTSDEASGDLYLAGDTIVEGAAPSATIIDANQLGNAFVAFGDGVVIRDLTVQNARKQPAAIGSGIANLGALSLENVHLRDNRGTIGGGVYNAGVLSLRHCVLQQNVATPFGGGAIGNMGGTVAIEDSDLSFNGADGRGGAIYNDGGIVTVERTSIRRHETIELGNEAGGIYSDGANAQLVVVNSSIEENITAGFGGGIGVFGGTAQLASLLVLGNSADYFGDFLSSIPNGPGSEMGGGIYAGPAASVQIRNTLVSSNERIAQYSDDADFDECGPNSLTSLDYLVISYPATCALVGVVTHVNTGDLPFIHVGLVEPNGGFAPMRGPDTAETTNQIPAESCTAPGGLPLRTDQRGYSRTGAGLCDIGAYEAGGWLTPDPLLGRNLLRNAGGEGDELGLARPQTVDSNAPYWRLEQGVRIEQMVYGAGGGFPGTADAPPGAGAYFFTGSTSELTVGAQEFDVSAAAAAIDAGTLRFDLSGWFGGFAVDDDYADLTAEFWSPESGFLESVTIGGFSPAERSNQTKLLRDSATGFVPPDTRNVYVYLRAVADMGVGEVSNDGYADRLSFSLPEPSSSAAALVVFASLAVLRRHRRAPIGASPRRPRRSRSAARARRGDLRREQPGRRGRSEVIETLGHGCLRGARYDAPRPRCATAFAPL
jgi:CSLREA domain-containing protein